MTTQLKGISSFDAQIDGQEAMSIARVARPGEAMRSLNFPNLGATFALRFKETSRKTHIDRFYA
ncbi:hypothetical protein GRI89_08000 [Altererythrobacter salegens]|uniref:Uncharacterized protein n=1 Tax=Croceibacterium salegens TaxID=1737568 RepID=A0A6I4SUD5_9SPHN|nr:hypothetical protein [Croceibacterium salegens]MXO59483.1 hypothetical protein [Croceibacterium salegens]